MNPKTDVMIMHNADSKASETSLDSHLILANQGNFSLPVDKISNEYYLSVLCLLCVFLGFVLAITKK